MKLLRSLVLFYCSSVLYIKLITAARYSVISDKPSLGVGVLINGTIVHVLKTSEETSVLFQGNAPSNLPYSYVQLDTNGTIIDREGFTRPPVASNTLNEFYGRNWNKKRVLAFDPLPPSAIPRKFVGTRRVDSQLHPKDEIPTLHIVAEPSQIGYMHHNVGEHIKATVALISTTSVQVFNHVKIKVGGKSTSKFSKLPYSLNFGDNPIEGFKKFKLRSTATDPSYMRDFICSELANAANQPVSAASCIRVIINDRPIGLFILMEDYDKSWLSNIFGTTSSPGILYEAHASNSPSLQANLEYLGDSNITAYTEAGYSVAVGGNENKLIDLVEFIRFIHDQQTFQTLHPDAIEASAAEWEKWLDVEGFLVSMALEFVNGDWDGFLANANNYFLYKNADHNTFTFISWDFDLNLGSFRANPDDVSTGDYRRFKGMHTRSIMIALLAIPKYQRLFEQHIKSIIQELYNPQHSFPVIDSIADFIKDDVAWDITLPRVVQGIETKNYTFEQLAQMIKPGADLSVLTEQERVVLEDGIRFFREKIPLVKAVNGPTGYSNLYSIKGWFKMKYDSSSIF